MKSQRTKIRPHRYFIQKSLFIKSKIEQTKIRKNINMGNLFDEK